MKFSKVPSLDTWNLSPGDGLIVAAEPGAWLKRLPPGPQWSIHDLTLDDLLDTNSILFVTNDLPLTSGIVASTITGIKYIVTDIDLQLEAVIILTHGGK